MQLKCERSRERERTRTIKRCRIKYKYFYLQYSTQLYLTDFTNLVKLLPKNGLHTIDLYYKKNAEFRLALMALVN